MRWFRPKENTYRTRKGFLLFPKTLDGETRWLEYTQWIQRFVNWPYYGDLWVDWAWADKTELVDEGSC